MTAATRCPSCQKDPDPRGWTACFDCRQLNGRQVDVPPTTTTHFVSASCEGVNCSVCGQPAQHKLGEEIPSDHPSMRAQCPECQMSWKWADGDGGHCTGIAHHFTGPVLHNLTAYVCCVHFTMIVGTAAGCPGEHVVHAGLLKQQERERLTAQISDLRATVVFLADDWNAHHARAAHVRALRKAANHLAEPFHLHAIETDYSLCSVEIQRAARGWAGRFEFRPEHERAISGSATEIVPDRLVFVRTERNHEDEEDDLYTIAEDIEQHILEPLAILLNAAIRDYGP